VPTGRHEFHRLSSNYFAIQTDIQGRSNNMRKLAPVLLLLLAPLLCPCLVLADDARAQELLKQARTAIGGEDALQKIQSLDIKGEYRRVLGEREMAGDREISISLPDKYLVEDAMNPGGLATAIISTKGLNGQHAWMGTSGGGGGSMVFRIGGPGGAQQPTPEEMEAMLRNSYRKEFTRYLLAIMMMPPADFAVEYKYAGESDVEGAQAEVIEVTGPEKFAIRIFFDKQTHLPLLLSYRGIKPRVMTMFNRPTDKTVKVEDAVKHAKEEADKKMAAEPAPKQEEVDFFIRVTDYKKASGLMLPHKLTFLTETEVSEEFQISKYQVNPQFKPERFQKN
jgi:hypothetical protein